MKPIFAMLIVFFVLSACSSREPAPTLTPSPTATLVSSPTPAPTVTPTETPTPENVEYPAQIEGGWNAEIMEGMENQSLGLENKKAWVDKEGTQHFEFTAGEYYGDKVEDLTPEQVEKITADLKNFCPQTGCIGEGTGGSLWTWGRTTGAVELLVHKNGEMEALTSKFILNNFKEESLQVIKELYLLPPYIDKVTSYYYKYLGLNSNSRFDMETISNVFSGGSLRQMISTINPSSVDTASPSWQFHGYRIDEIYLKQLQDWNKGGFDPADDMVLIIY